MRKKTNCNEFDYILLSYLFTRYNTSIIIQILKTVKLKKSKNKNFLTQYKILFKSKIFLVGIRELKR